MPIPYVTIGLMAAFAALQAWGARKAAKTADAQMALQGKMTDKQIALAATTQSRQAAAVQQAMFDAQKTKREAMEAMSKQANRAQQGQAVVQGLPIMTQMVQMLMGGVGDEMTAGPTAQAGPGPEAATSPEAMALVDPRTAYQRDILQGADTTNPLSYLRQQGLLEAPPIV